MKNENNIAPINEDLNEAKYEVEKIKQKIYVIRGKQVMLDSDVAEKYHYTTKNINKAMKRNIERFPKDFCFQLTEEEIENLRFQNGTSSLEEDNYGGRRYLPYVYTEQGIAMLSGLLKNEIAVQVSINIMRAFVEMRKYIFNNQLILEKINNIELSQLEYKIVTNERLEQYDKKFENIFREFEKYNKNEIKQKIFFDGQIWDSYSLVISIIKKANNKITIIDNYIDESILDMLSKKKQNVEVVIITSEKSNISKLDIEKFNKEYPMLKVVKNNKFHDRFVIIDNKELYNFRIFIKRFREKMLCNK